MGLSKLPTAAADVAVDELVEAAVGNFIQRVASGVVHLHLQPVAETVLRRE